MENVNRKTQTQLFEANFLHCRGSKSGWPTTTVTTSSELFQVIWITNGKASCRVDMHQFPIVGDTLYCLFPGQLHYFDPHEDVTGYRIAFAQDFLKPDFGAVNGMFSAGYWGADRATLLMQLKGDLLDEIEQVVEEMVWEFDHDLHLKYEVLKGLLNVFLAYVTKQLALSANSHVQLINQPVFERFIELVGKKFSTHKLVNQYADELAVTPNYLSEVVKRASGFSASHYIRRRVILEAKRIALTSDHTMKEIAFQVGFEDPCRFSKFFKMETGITFSEFKKTFNHQPTFK